MTIQQVDTPSLVKGFTEYDAHLSNGITLRFAAAGQGETLVLLHGHPQNHATWHKVAPILAKQYYVILPDIRGYGDSDRPPSDNTHRAYSKRVMAHDIILLMDELQITNFYFVGHDRGARVGHRLALDYPSQLTKAVFLDIAPTATMYAMTNKEFATRYFWWFFLIQPQPLPEKLIGADPEFFLRKHIDGQLKTPNALSDEIFKDYLRCYENPKMIHAVCEDYRAAATIDLSDDDSDQDKLIQCPLLVLWGSKGTVGQLYDVLAIWQQKAVNVEGMALDCGHSTQEEIADEFLLHLQKFLQQN